LLGRDGHPLVLAPLSMTHGLRAMEPVAVVRQHIFDAWARGGDGAAVYAASKHAKTKPAAYPMSVTRRAAARR
jgi:hypothetical protein